MKFKGVLKLTYTVEASDHNEAKQKIAWLINQDEDTFLEKIQVVDIT